VFQWKAFDRELEAVRAHIAAEQAQLDERIHCPTMDCY
jgi:hypothetical protein